MPHGLALGPHVQTWASASDLDALATADPRDVEDRVMRCLLSAHTSWNAARREWLTRNGLGRLEGLQRLEGRRLLPHRHPYWGMS